jgi:hypothetical protein
MGMGTTGMSRAACALGTAAALAGALPSTASAAAAATLRDGNDTVGPLDVRSVTERHGPIGPVSFAITTYGPWRARQLDLNRGRGILIFLDTGGTPAFDRYALVSYSHGSLHARVHTIRGRLIGRGTATRSSRRSLTVTLRRRLIGARGPGFGYGVFTVFQTAGGACGSGCVDAVPNRRVARADLTAPTVTFGPIPPPASTTVSLHVTVTDVGGSGLGSWALEQRAAGAGPWTAIAKSGRAGTHAVSITRAEGSAFDFRVVARDREGNATVSPVRSVSFPIDDANPAFTYAGTWSQAEADPADYQGTLETSADATTPATATLTFQGASIELFGRGLCGTGSVTIDGAPAGSTAQLCGSEHRAVIFSAASLGAGAHTLVLTVTGGELALDGALGG